MHDCASCMSCVCCACDPSLSGVVVALLFVKRMRARLIVYGNKNNIYAHLCVEGRWVRQGRVIILKTPCVGTTFRFSNLCLIKAWGSRSLCCVRLWGGGTACVFLESRLVKVGPSPFVFYSVYVILCWPTTFFPVIYFYEPL